jgi:hypothetical protein
MKSGHWLWLFLSLLTLSCAPRPLTPPPPVPAQTVAILPPNNRTDDPLVVGGESLWDVFFPQSRQTTIADVLVAEARAQLEQRGFRVVPTPLVEAAIGDRSLNSVEEAAALAAQGQLEGQVLYIEIKQWESDPPLGPLRVFVSVNASLIDTASGRIVWTTHRPLQPVPTPGAINQSTAYMIAAHQVTKELLGSWGTQRPTS